MKPFLGIDLTNNKKNEEVSGSEFITQTPAPALLESLEGSTDEVCEIDNRSKLPLPLRIIQTVCGFVALVTAGGLLKSSVSFAEGYRNAPALYWIGGICLILWLILWICSKLKSKSVLETEESTQTLSKFEGISDAIFRDLNVPADAKEVDVLSFYYKNNDGTIKVCEKALQMSKYTNPIFHAFADDENLYLANFDGKYTFPRSELQVLRRVDKRIQISDWNKEEPFDKGRYKEYKLTTDNYDRIHCKCYYILELTHNGDLWGIYIPCYELPVFQALTGLTVQ